MVLFPGMILPITIGRDNSIAGAQQAVKSERPIGIVLQRNPEIERPGMDDLFPVGTRANVLRYVTTPDGAHHIICQGQQRFRVVELLEGYPFLAARVGPDRRTRSERQGNRGAFHAAEGARPRGAATDAAGVAGTGGRGAEHRFGRGARRHGRRPHGHQGAGKAETAGSRRSGAAPGRRARSAGAAHRSAAPVARNRRAHQGEHGRAPARVSAARAAQVDPEGAGRRRRGQRGRNRGAQESHRRCANAGRSGKAGDQGIEAPGADVGRLGRILDGAQLSRLADRAAVESARDRHDRHRRGETHPGRGPFRPGDGEKAHSRIPRGAQAQSRRPRTDTVLRRPARRGQDFARPEHRPRARTQVRARVARRRARRGRDPRPPPHLYRRAAGQHHPGAAQRPARAAA